MSPNDRHTERPETWHAALHRLQRDGVPHALATQVTSAGSTPREPGARMVITAEGVHDTLGGGTFEWQTIEAARQRLEAGQAGMTLEAFSLGGRSGQCCGGFVNVLIEVFPGSQTTLAIFGAGHVGTELVRLAAPLPWRVLWHDSRDDIFPDWADATPRLECRPSPEPGAAVSRLPAGSHVLVLTHDHAEDRELMDALLARGDMGSIGLIGSRSKWASFRSRLSAAGHSEAALAKVRCPIGTAHGPAASRNALSRTKGSDKTPYAIALATLAELLALVDQAAAPPGEAQRGLDPAELRALF
ncbi:xanthine dehydrogenase accessory protein XdhC [Halomonas urumqiensis]|uniref:Xanthine dehydrogenase accessory protein XdhC n=1 Tax=Halomonas urumqiensis TaxID=1684789 RepID=A0A2N7UPU8_9GAMM|nr:xanthine dehydrogenase accessory protein XdhC [Halomonas urumqiensis]PMR82453.1 xanthine dehydrogenase accessory protein XdhC [Halomonas urumqiensis]PTB04066.1 xanthine dehydrogenase accessory protein XdhC [Halomonas urumqiensis]GHE19672.1 xanthine dehydrogenase accessory protein XdhC [Halomonas urumqiensis]